ncbi:2'-5' RNA ligase family protein [Herbiconiux liukaitaii]|uniref:2'-5' RNA ligase family protein n=1 Tax=Herbiconiux liukaitaii TaxID=3342799 RepID=UPI0035B713C1
MTVVSLELLLDEATEARIRSEWAALAAAGLSSLAAHTAPSNRPHITLLVREAGPGLEAQHLAARLAEARAEAGLVEGRLAESRAGAALVAGRLAEAQSEASLMAGQLADAQSDSAAHSRAGAGAGALVLPLAVALGAPLLFGAGDRRVLARSVVPSAGLLRLHAAIHSLVGPGDDAPHTRPGEWTPHVTLARRLRLETLPQALTLLDAAPAGADADSNADEGDATATAARHWDSDTATATTLRHWDAATATATTLRHWDAATATVTDLLRG